MLPEQQPKCKFHLLTTFYFQQFFPFHTQRDSLAIHFLHVSQCVRKRMKLNWRLKASESRREAFQFPFFVAGRTPGGKQLRRRVLLFPFGDFWRRKTSREREYFWGQKARGFSLSKLWEKNAVAVPEPFFSYRLLVQWREKGVQKVLWRHTNNATAVPLQTVQWRIFFGTPAQRVEWEAKISNYISLWTLFATNPLKDRECTVRRDEEKGWTQETVKGVLKSAPLDLNTNLRSRQTKEKNPFLFFFFRTLFDPW